MRRLVLLLSVVTLGTLAACDNSDETPPEARAVVPEADVERLRIRLFEATIPLDAELAAVEADAAAAPDSSVRAAYGPILDQLRENRRRLQARVDTLRPMPRARFDSAAVGAERHVAELRAAVARARLEATPTAATLRAAVAAELARLDGRLGAVRARLAADTTAHGRVAAFDSLDAARARLIARLDAYPDTSQAAYGAFRASAITEALAIRSRADRIAPDSTAVVRFRRDTAPAAPVPAAAPTGP